MGGVIGDTVGRGDCCGESCRCDEVLPRQVILLVSGGYRGTHRRASNGAITTLSSGLGDVTLLPSARRIEKTGTRRFIIKSSSSSAACSGVSSVIVLAVVNGHAWILEMLTVEMSDKPKLTEAGPGIVIPGVTYAAS